LSKGVVLMESILVALRWAGSLGIFGWLMFAMTNSQGTGSTSDQPQDVPPPVAETRSPPASDSSIPDSTIQDIMQLRARFGTGIGTPEEFQSAIESIFNADSEATFDKKANVYWNEDMSPKTESGTCRRDPCQPPIMVVGALPSLEEPMLPMHVQPIPPKHSQPLPLMYSQPMPPVLSPPVPLPPNCYPALSLAPSADYPPSNANVVTNFVSAHPGADRSQVLRKAARSLEEAAWELESRDEYKLADQLRQQAIEIYHQARNLQ